MTLVIAAFLGFISVAFGAYAEHGLKAQISDEQFRFLMTAVRYNQIHAAVLTALGLSMFTNWNGVARITPTLASFFFTVGVILFSFGIYVSVAFDIPAVLKVAPAGGMSLMAGWLCLAYLGLKLKKSVSSKLC